MKNQIATLTTLVAFAMSLQVAVGKPSAKVEIIQPFETWLATEIVDFYVRITNVGAEPLKVIGYSESDIFFELDPTALSSTAYRAMPFPKVERANTPEFKGMLVPPGGHVMLSDRDYNDINISTPEYSTRVRVHFLIERGVWFTSDWTTRNILPVPDMTHIKPLFEFELSPMFKGQPLEEVRPLKVGDETWLFTSRSPSYAGRRFCRVPDGVKPTAFTYDQEARRLTIQFDNGEEPVIINTRTGAPLTGSERTVPHLHLWKNLSGRPFTDVYQNTLDSMAHKKAAAQGKSGLPQPAPVSPVNPPEGIAPQNQLSQKPQPTAAPGESIPRRNVWWPWLVFAALVVSGSVAAVLRWRHRQSKSS